MYSLKYWSHEFLDQKFGFYASKYVGRQHSTIFLFTFVFLVCFLYVFTRTSPNSKLHLWLNFRSFFFYWDGLRFPKNDDVYKECECQNIPNLERRIEWSYQMLPNCIDSLRTRKIFPLSYDISKLDAMPTQLISNY